MYMYISEETYFAVVYDRKTLVVEIEVGLYDLSVSRLCSNILVFFTGFLLNTNIT